MLGRPRHKWGDRRGRTALVTLVLVLAWAAVAVPVAGLVFVNSSRTTVVAGHESVVRPTLDGWVEVSLGPVLPSFRYPTGGRVGADIELGKTTATDYDELVRRYAFLAGQPRGQIAKVEDVMRGMALAAGLTGALAGLAVPGLWLLLGADRRREIRHSRRAQAATAVVVVSGVLGTVLLVQRPWDPGADRLDRTEWTPLATALPDLSIPARARPLQVDAGLLTRGTERLVASALDSYAKSSQFYTDAAESVPEVADLIRKPEEGETVALLVSDRHDNIGMDPVARAVADAGGATWLMSAGDDTSTGGSWEAFSLESLDEAFEDYETRLYVAGNHDHGGFITEQAARLGFTPLNGEVTEGPDGVRVLGVHDPRSSGLGNWRDESGLSFDEVAEKVADTACAAEEDGERISTVLVHDRNLGRPALDRGCVDLVLSGHLHVIDGPEPIEGEDGQVGYTYTTGTTGGAAYAIAIGTKPRRDASVSLVTYAEGRPTGIQGVTLSPLGEFTVGPWTPLTDEEGLAAPGP